MKKFLVVIILLVLLSAAGYFVFQYKKSTPAPAPTITPQPSTAQSAFCIPSQLQATIQPNGAAGNIYATITIKNISTIPCTIVGNNTLKVEYPLSVENFQTVIKKQPTTSIFTLAPNQTIFSLLHYPNGPQCSDKATGVNSSVSYDISQKDSITFTPTTGSTIVIPSCEKVTEMTTIDLYPFSNKEVTP